MQLLTKAQKEKMIKNHQEQDGTKDFKAVIKGDTPEKENADVTSIDTRTMSYNDSRPWMHCLDCSAELDGFRDVDYEAVCS